MSKPLLAEKIQEFAKCHIYQGHWEFGLSEEADQQFDDLTELYRHIWMKEGKAWLNLARAWNSLKPKNNVI